MSQIPGNASSSPESSLLYNQEIADFLRPYREFKQFNVSSLKDVSLYLVAEEHSDKTTHLMQAALINHLASQGPIIILHEGLPSGEVLGDDYKDHFLDMRHLDPCNKNNITIIGWDASEDTIRSVGAPDHLLNQIEKNIVESGGKAIALFQEINSIAPGMLKNPLDSEPDFQIFMTIERPKYEIVKQLIIELKTTNKAIEDGIQTHKKLKETPVKSNILDQIFPERTEAMISVLHRIEDIKQDLGYQGAKVVLIAGIKHLKTDVEDKDKPEYDLSKLYLELSNHKAAILIPPHIWE